MTSGRSVPSLGCLLPARSLCSSGVIFSPRFACRLSGRGAGRICRAVELCGLSCRLSLVPSCRSACRRGDWLLVGVPRFVARCGRLVAYPAWFVPVNRHGWRGGSLVALCLLGCGWRVSVWIMWSVLFSVDYLGAGGYINTRALDVVFSFLCFLARACCAGGSMVLRPHRSRHRPNKTVPPGHDGSGFFYRFSFHLIPSFGCLLTCGLLLPDYSHIHIASSIRPAFLDTEDWEVMSCDVGGGGWVSCLPRASGDGWQRWRNDCDVVIA